MLSEGSMSGVMLSEELHAEIKVTKIKIGKTKYFFMCIFMCIKDWIVQIIQFVIKV